MSTKAVRFSAEEDSAIKDFLKTNKYLDFSTVARIAIMRFIENPEMNLKPTKVDNEATNKSKRIQ